MTAPTIEGCEQIGFGFQKSGTVSTPETETLRAYQQPQSNGNLGVAWDGCFVDFVGMAVNLISVPPKECEHCQHEDRDQTPRHESSPTVEAVGFGLFILP
jgi:hypothetical protein